MIDKAVHAFPVEHLADALDTHIHQGLGQKEADRRLAEHGPNELQERPRPGFLQMLWGQLNNFLVIILIVASLVSLLLGEVIDATAIIAIVVLNSILGIVQESRAEKALAALKKMAAPNAQVIRDGHQITIPSRELVQGDIVLLEAGNYVPADLRLVESVNLKIEEASLTGESLPVEKNAQVVLDSDIPLGDRKNSAFMSTVVTYGRGRGLVTSTGMHTQIGLIAEMIQSYEEEPTPLQMKLDQLGKWLGSAALAICGLIFLIGIVRDTNPMEALSKGFLVYLGAHQREIVELFMTAVSLAIAAVPEGLPAVVTICLALGMQRMVARHALIRKLPAVETLGCATVICSDKTGTLTQNKMTVVRGWASGRTFHISGEGYVPRGQFSRGNDNFDPHADPAVSLLLQGGLLCNDAKLEESGSSQGDATWRMVGDPTEGAMVVAAAKAGYWKGELEMRYPRVAEIPFDSERKRMTTIHQVDQETSKQGTRGTDFFATPYVAYVKGAPDIILDLCQNYVTDNQVRPLTAEKRQEILAIIEEMAQAALRVLGVACRPWDNIPSAPTPETVEQELTFVGLMGMIDQARPEVKPAVALAKQAGLKSIMITGDYKDTAVAIAREIGLLTPKGRVLTGAELEAMSQEDFAKIVEEVEVYARSSPQHKVRIVDALKERGHVVAMTGDGVNDAPALKRANIGVAMGITGTDVSKEVADIVLTDDNYASIVSAIEQGRIIYSNIRKVVFYLVACNIPEILIIFVPMLLGLPLPLRPLQILWINLVTDGLPAIALGLEKGEAGIMQRPPRPPKEPVLNRPIWIGVAIQAVFKTTAVLVAFLWSLAYFPDNLALAQTITFITLAGSQIFLAYSARSEFGSLFSVGLFSNRTMLVATSTAFLLLIPLLYVPFLRSIFDTVPLGLTEWMLMIPLMFVATVAAEIGKMVRRRRAKATPVSS